MKFALLLLGGFLCGLHGAEGQDTELLSMITKLQTEVQALKTQDQALKTQIQDLETKDQFNQSEVQSLQSEVQGLKNQIKNLEAKDQSHQSEVQALKNQIQDLETKDQFNQSEVQSLQSEVQALKTQDQALKNQMQTLEISQAQLQNSPRVAFYAGLSTGDRRAASWETIKYNKVLTNVGGAYSTDTGKFTAPLKGLYVFSFVMSTINHINVMLMRNIEILAYTYIETTTDKRDSSSGVAVVTLEAGDTVYVELLGYSSSYSGSGLLNTFSGFLLSPM